MVSIWCESSKPVLVVSEIHINTSVVYLEHVYVKVIINTHTHGYFLETGSNGVIGTVAWVSDGVSIIETSTWQALFVINTSVYDPSTNSLLDGPKNIVSNTNLKVYGCNSWNVSLIGQLANNGQLNTWQSQTSNQLLIQSLCCQLESS